MLEYYSYILCYCYIDDALVIHHGDKGVLHHLDKYFKLKLGSMSDPNIYLGAKLKKMRLENGVWSWEPARNMCEFI
eukprot:8427552-Ditylum_brightwellii.AAC.1